MADRPAEWPLSVTKEENTMVYLIRFSEPISPNHTTQYYLGSTNNLPRRVQEHRQESKGMFGAAKARGINWRVVRCFTGGFEVEKRLKRQKNNRRMCPIATKGRPYTPTFAQEIDCQVALEM